MKAKLQGRASGRPGTQSILTSEAFVKVSLWAFGGGMPTTYTYFIRLFLFLYQEGKKAGIRKFFVSRKRTFVKKKIRDNSEIDNEQYIFSKTRKRLETLTKNPGN